MPQGPSTRWCPTPEQLMILEGMYKGGVRTPNAPLIQHITGLLSRYGKIEGKNVFYWFQNHKARDRLKIRRRIHRHQLLLQQQHYRCLGKAQLFHLKMELNHSPQISSTNHFQLPSQFLAQEIYQERRPPMDLLCKLERREREGMDSSGYHNNGEDWVSRKDACLSRPIKTLDLFPTKSTGLKETCRRLGSPTCSSASITN